MSSSKNMDQKIPYDDYQLPVVFLPSYESPPAWIPSQEVAVIGDYVCNTITFVIILT